MKNKADDLGPHPEGEVKTAAESYPAPQRLETFGGVVEVRWEEDPGVSMHGGLAYFVEFLKVSGIWEKFVITPSNTAAEFPVAPPTRLVSRDTGSRPSR